MNREIPLLKEDLEVRTIMKMLISIVVTAITLLAQPVSATRLIPSLDNAVQDQCTPENKNAWYEEFLRIRTTDQAKAFELAKKQLACPPTGEVTEAQQKIVDYLKKWTTAYEAGSRRAQVRDLLYNKQKYAEAYELGRQILATEPDNLKLLVDLGASGYLVTPLKNQQLNNEALSYARKALQLIESGKVLDDWQPMASKDVAIAYLNYTIGALTIEKEPASAIKNLINSVRVDTPLKKSPYTYAYIAGAYETGAYAKQSEQYKTLYAGKDETPESKLALESINQVVDRMIDAYARAVALAGNDARFATAKQSWMESLTTWYKYRHQDSDAGITEFIAGIVSKPLPAQPTP